MELCAKRKGGISHTKHLDLACLILRRVIKIRDQLPMLTIGFTVQSSINTSSKRNSYSRYHIHWFSRRYHIHWFSRKCLLETFPLNDNFKGF